MEGPLTEGRDNMGRFSIPNSRLPVLRSLLSTLGLGLLLVAAATAARGDGGTVRFNGPAGPFEVTVFTAPAPFRAGPVDISVMVRGRSDRQPILDAQVAIRLEQGGTGGATVEASATRKEATNKLLYATLVELPLPGEWNLHVTVRHGKDQASISQRLEAAPRLPAPLAYWPYLVLPPLVVALFLLHQRLGRRNGRG